MYKKGLKGVLKHWDFILIDMICLQLAFLLSCRIRNGADFRPYANDVYISVAVISEAACAAAAVLFNTMKNVLKRGFFREVKAGIVQSLFVMLMTSLFLFSIKSGELFSRAVLYMTGAAYGFSALCARCFWKKALLKMNVLNVRRMIVITSEDIAEDTVRTLNLGKIENYSICGVACTDGCSADDFDGVPVIAGDEKGLTEYLCREWVDEVFIAYPAGSAFPAGLTESLITMGMTVHYSIPEAGGGLGEKRTVEKLGGYTVITSSISAVRTEQLLLKRCIDILGGIVGCLLTGIIFIFLAPAIKAQSPGSVFFVQERIGRNGKRFKMYKFRSMYTDAEERKKELMERNRSADGMTFKLDYDPRIIGCRQLPDGTVKKGLGNFIRETSIDEFPQFFNVLKGEMSIVGTRPPTPDEWDRYDLHHRARMSVKPGITGMWQVSGRSSITDFEEIVRLDKKYISEWSLLLDIKIILKTIAVVLGRKGSM